jgi:hypothetical protein
VGEVDRQEGGEWSSVGSRVWEAYRQANMARRTACALLLEALAAVLAVCTAALGALLLAPSPTAPAAGRCCPCCCSMSPHTSPVSTPPPPQITHPKARSLAPVCTRTQWDSWYLDL